jgi:hypothetical protein
MNMNEMIESTDYEKQYPADFVAEDIISGNEVNEELPSDGQITYPLNRKERRAARSRKDKIGKKTITWEKIWMIVGELGNGMLSFSEALSDINRVANVEHNLGMQKLLVEAASELNYFVDDYELIAGKIGDRSGTVSNNDLQLSAELHDAVQDTFRRFNAFTTVTLEGMLNKETDAPQVAQLPTPTENFETESKDAE